MKRIPLVAAALLALTGAAHAGVLESLESTEVNLNFVDTPLSEAITFLASYSGVNMVVDPELDRRLEGNDRLVTLKAEGVTVKSALDLIAMKKRAAWEVRWGAAFLSTETRLGELPRALLTARPAGKVDQALLARLRKETVSFRFDGATLGEALEFIRNVKAVNIVIADEVRPMVEKLPVSFGLSGAALEDAFALLLLPRGLSARLRDGVVYVVRGRVDPKRALEEGKVTLEATARPVEEILAKMSVAAGVPIRMDPGVAGSVITVKFDAVPVKAALDQVAALAGLAWDFRWAGVFVSNEERLRSVPKEAPAAALGTRPEEWEVKLHRRLDTERITFSFAGATATEALGFISNLKGINIVVDPKAAERLGSTTVNLEVRNVRMLDALSLVLLPRGFTFELEHEVVVVKARP